MGQAKGNPRKPKESSMTLGKGGTSEDRQAGDLFEIQREKNIKTCWAVTLGGMPGVD